MRLEQPGPAQEAIEHDDPPPGGRYRWYHKVGSVLFIIVTFEIGVVLLVFPWLRFWEPNYFGSFSVEWYRLWQSFYLRGAVSGLGLVNIYISLIEMLRLRRFSNHE